MWENFISSRAFGDNDDAMDDMSCCHILQNCVLIPILHKICLDVRTLQSGAGCGGCLRVVASAPCPKCVISPPESGLKPRIYISPSISVIQLVPLEFWQDVGYSSCFEHVSNPKYALSGQFKLLAFCIRTIGKYRVRTLR